VRLRGFGKFAIKVGDCRLLLNTLVGTQGIFTTEQLEDYLRDRIVARLTDVLGTVLTSVLDLPSQYDELAATARARTAEDFRAYGLELTELMITAITPPEEVEKTMDARAGMGAVGDLNAFMKFQAAQAMRDAASSGGEASGAMQAGMGAGFGMMMPGMIKEAMAAGPSTPAPSTAPQSSPASPAPAGAKFCSECGQALQAGAKFCSSCGAKLAPPAGA
jgi:membrane protease subunit (stomatin/prohibitin family)